MFHYVRVLNGRDDRDESDLIETTLETRFERLSDTALVAPTKKEANVAAATAPAFLFDWETNADPYASFTVRQALLREVPSHLRAWWPSADVLANTELIMKLALDDFQRFVPWFAHLVSAVATLNAAEQADRFKALFKRLLVDTMHISKKDPVNELLVLLVQECRVALINAPAALTALFERLALTQRVEIIELINLDSRVIVRGVKTSPLIGRLVHLIDNGAVLVPALLAVLHVQEGGMEHAGFLTDLLLGVRDLIAIDNYEAVDEQLIAPLLLLFAEHREWCSLALHVMGLLNTSPGLAEARPLAAFGLAYHALVRSMSHTHLGFGQLESYLAICHRKLPPALEQSLMQSLFVLALEARSPAMVARLFATGCFNGINLEVSLDVVAKVLRLDFAQAPEQALDTFRALNPEQRSLFSDCVAQVYREGVRIAPQVLPFIADNTVLFFELFDTSRMAVRIFAEMLNLPVGDDDGEGVVLYIDILLSAIAAQTGAQFIALLTALHSHGCSFNSEKTSALVATLRFSAKTLDKGTESADMLEVAQRLEDCFWEWNFNNNKEEEFHTLPPIFDDDGDVVEENGFTDFMDYEFYEKVY